MWCCNINTLHVVIHLDVYMYMYMCIYMCSVHNRKCGLEVDEHVSYSEEQVMKHAHN